MEYHTFLFPFAIIILGLVCRLPFKNFPLDDDFAIYTYRSRFAQRGFKWKKDIQLIGNPFWKMPLLDAIYADPKNGTQRLRSYKRFSIYYLQEPYITLHGHTHKTQWLRLLQVCFMHFMELVQIL